MSALPYAVLHRLLWASAFRLGQGQCVTYYQGRWLLAGDAAYAMGPSAGVGMMVGLLGVWCLGWRLALLMQHNSHQTSLLEDYTREQQAALLSRDIAPALQKAPKTGADMQENPPKAAVNAMGQVNMEKFFMETIPQRGQTVCLL